MEENEDHNDTIAQEGDYSQVIAILTNMFGQIMDTNAINTIVETCDGNLSQSIELIMNMDENEKTSPAFENLQVLYTAQLNVNDDRPSLENNTSVTTQSINTPQITTSYATISKTTGAVPKKQNQVNKPRKSLLYFSEGQMTRICNYNKEYRVLVIMRGPPGCGKSYLARQIVDVTVGPGETNYKKHICSSDDYFFIRGKYVYNRDRLGDAHVWNQNRVRQLIQQGFSPIIVDNTNIVDWETEPYVRNGVKEGYYIEVAIPETPWAGNSHQLFKKNTHNVPLPKIRKMLNSFTPNTTGDYLIKLFRLSYSIDKSPPVLKQVPVLNRHLSASVMKKPFYKIANSHEYLNLPSTSTNQNTCNQTSNRDSEDHIENESINDVDKNIIETASGFSKNYTEIEQKLQEFNVLEQAWENNENWDDKSPTANEVAPIDAREPKPQRGLKENPAQLLPSVKEWQDWRAITTFLPSWAQDSTSTTKENLIPVETVSSSTCVEIGDFHNAINKYKIIASYPRDINMFYMPQQEKIPDQRMLDKSTVTHEHLITGNYRCKNEDKHFVAFRKMFRNIARADLREIFDKCCGDVNWAVEIVLDGVASNHIDMNDDMVQSDTEELDDELCQCTAAYNVIPEVFTETVPENSPTVPENTSPSIQRKLKKDKAVSESAMELKKQFEQNFTINDNHYSQHCLKIKKYRSGQTDPESITPSASVSDSKLPSIDTVASASKQDRTYGQYDISDVESDVSEDFETTVNVNLGADLLRQLDGLFGRKELTYPSNIVPLVNMPMSILNTINALWIESLSNQLETQSDYSKILLKQDEDFARELAMKEAQELAQTEAGNEPKIPDFKLIMDMDLALSLYQKNVAEWRNNESTDIATKMTKAKLYDLFPDVRQDVLSELLMAHDNNFQATVEGLLVSTGQANVLETQNGINKFIMEKEKTRHRMHLEQEKQKVIEEGKMWYMLEDTSNVNMHMVHKHREWAQDLLNKRNNYLAVARNFLNAGMWECAEYYSAMATFFTKQYETANSLAATCLVQINSINIANTTLDLHLLYVKEAMETLDLFLDHHIQLARSNQGKGKTKSQTLHVITGRGAHSRGGPKIRPAAKIRLRQRGFEVYDMNPGLVCFQIDKTHKMTYELAQSN